MLPKKKKPSITKVIFISLSILLVLLIAFVLFSPTKSTKTSPQTVPQPKTSSSADNQTPDFGNSTIYQDVVTDSDGAFTIDYLVAEDSYLISILHSPFKDVRLQAEQSFLKKLNLTQTQACKLKVTITTPNFANEAESGKEYPLSFCR